MWVFSIKTSFANATEQTVRHWVVEKALSFGYGSSFSSSSSFDLLVLLQMHKTTQNMNESGNIFGKCFAFRPNRCNERQPIYGIEVLAWEKAVLEKNPMIKCASKIVLIIGRFLSENWEKIWRTFFMNCTTKNSPKVCKIWENLSQVIYVYQLKFLRFSAKIMLKNVLFPRRNANENFDSKQSSYITSCPRPILNGPKMKIRIMKNKILNLRTKCWKHGGKTVRSILFRSLFENAFMHKRKQVKRVS